MTLQGPEFTTPYPPTAGSDTSPVIFTIGVVADTHIPDRTRTIHPGILPALQASGVQHILHAGDISTRRVLDELSSIAPVTAVRGNRDLLLRHLPMVAQLELGGVRIALTHGHGGWGPYLRDKIKFYLQGYRLERYMKVLRQAGPQAKVIVFGHTHFPVLTYHAGQLLFNPGSASIGCLPSSPPTLGLLRVTADHQVTAELVPLPGWRIKMWRWVAI